MIDFRLHTLSAPPRAALRGHRRRTSVIFFAAAVLALAVSHLGAKPLSVPFASEYQAEIWDLNEGFPENSCSGIVAAPDGYLWLGTFRGLVRFNGQAFAHWGPPAMPELASTSIISMYRDRRGRIWLSTMEGLVCHEGATWRRWQEDGGWLDRSDYVRSFADGPDGSVIFGRFSGRVVRFADQRFTELPNAPGTGGARCGCDQDNVPYVVRNGYAGFWREGAWHAIVDQEDLPTRAFGSGQDAAGHALIVCQGEILRLRSGQIVSRLPLSLGIRPYWQLVSDAHGTLWLPGVEAGVFRIDSDGTVKHLLKSDGLPHSGGTRAVFTDERSGVWIGSGVGGLARLRSKRFRYLGESEGLGDKTILTLAALRDGRILMTSSGAGPSYFDGIRVVRLPPLNDPKIASVRAVVRTEDDTVWLGSFGHGLFRLRDGELTATATEIFGATETIHTMFVDSQNRLWVGGERRVAVGRGDVFQEVIFAEEPQRRQPTLFAESPDGTVVLTKHHEIYAFGPDGLRARPLVRLPEKCRISSLAFDPRQRLWIGTTDMGLFVHQENRLAQFPANAGLPSHTISSLIFDDQGRLWFGCGRAIVRTDPEELWNVIQGRAEHVEVPVFTSDDGLRDLDLPYGNQPCAVKDASGRLWFALVRGAAMIDPATLKLNREPPKVVFESLSYVPHGANEPITLAVAPATSPLVLPAGSRSIRIGYAALDFVAPRTQRFRVRLGGHEGRWQDMRDETAVSFLELLPGAHSIQVQASGSDGVWNRTGATLRFVVTPFYWQTTWFRVALALGLMSAVGGGVWYGAHRRVRRVRAGLERERRLAEVQARLALVLENTSDFVVFADPDGRVIFINRAGRALIGLAPGGDLALLPVRSLFSERAGAEFTSVALPAALQTGTWSGESTLRHATGAEIPVSQVVNAHYAIDGHLSFTSMIARDISVAKRHAAVQEALRRLATDLTASLEPQQLGRAVAATARHLFGHDAFLLVLAEAGRDAGTCVYMEDTPEGATAPQPYPSRDLSLGVCLRLVFDGVPLLLNRPSTNPASTAAAQEPWGASTRMSQSLMFAPILWNGRISGVVSVQSYTPEQYDSPDLELLQTVAAHCGAAIARLEAEASLRRNEERLRLAMQAARMGSWEAEIASRQLLASPEAAAVYAWPSGRLSGTLDDLAAGTPAEEATELSRQLQLLVAGHATELNFVHRLITPAGAEQWLEVKARRQQESDGGGRARILGVTADVTARRLAELERAKLEDQLRQSQKLEAIGTLAGGIAHDFNNILTAVIGNIELARLDEEAGLPTREYLDSIHTSSMRARDLVRRILAFSRPGDQRRFPTSVLPAVHEVVKLLRATIPANVELIINAPASLPLVVTSGTDLHQVLLNLGTNAWHALKKHPGKIEFTLDTYEFSVGQPPPAPQLTPGRFLRISVADTGTGIAPEVLPRIFDPFFTTKETGEGTGLGLSVAHGIMRACGGAITVQSALGLGSKFTLHFPVATSTASASHAPLPAAVAEAPPGRGERILYVDDEGAVVLVFERVLSRAGYAVTGCTRPREALAQFAANPAAFALVVTDHSMPDLTGLEFAAEILRLRAGMPIILATGYRRPGLAEEAQAIGISLVIDKTLQPGELVRTIAQFLAQSESPR